MAGQTAKPTLAGKFGAEYRKAADAGQKAPVRHGRPDMPGDIKNGIARLVRVEVKEYDGQSKMKQLDGSSAVGQLYVVFTGAVVEPKEHLVDGSPMPTEGIQFYETIPVCKKGAQYKWLKLESLDDCVREVQNLMRSIAGDNFDARDVDKAAEVLTQKKPLFRFKTRTRPAVMDDKDPTKVKYEARVDVEWLGGSGLENYKDPTAGAAAIGADRTGQARAAGNGQPAPQTAAPPAEGPAPFNEFSVEEDAALVDANPDAVGVDGSPENAANTRLTTYATENGLTDDDIGTFGSWKEILAHIAEQSGGDAGAEAGDDDVVEEDEPAPEPWKKGDECDYVAPVKGPGGKERAGTKAVRCKVVGLNKSGTKANVVDVKDGKKKWENVPVESLARPG